MMIDTIHTKHNDKDPLGVTREVSETYGSAIRIDQNSSIIESAKNQNQQVKEIVNFLVSKGMLVNNFEYQATDGQDMIFKFKPMKRMATMSSLNLHAPDFYNDEEDFTGKAFYQAIDAVAAKFEMDAEALFELVSPLFYTVENSHEYYLIAVPQ